MKDYMIRATAAEGQVRAFAAYTTNMVEEARKAHDTSPVVTAALGRLFTAAAMMGSMMKGEKDTLTLKVEGGGPIRSMIVMADAYGHVKGYPTVPRIPLMVNSNGKLDVASGVGVGLLTVTRDIGLKEPYTGTCELITSEIAEDITYYFASSEQTPSSVGLGVLVSDEETVTQAGGFIIQLMPDATEETVCAIEEKLSQVTSVTSLLEKGYTPEDILNEILGSLGLEILDNIEVEFKCDCSKEKVENAIASLSKEDIDSIIEDGNPIEVKCHYCNKSYHFGLEDLKKLK